MERNSENRNRYGNDRNKRQNDQYNDRNQSSDYQQNRDKNWDSDENQWETSSRGEGHNQRGNFGGFSDRNNDRGIRNGWKNENIRDEQRLESMGSLGNDWTNRNDTNDYDNPGNYESRDSGNY